MFCGTLGFIRARVEEYWARLYFSTHMEIHFDEHKSNHTFHKCFLDPAKRFYSQVQNLRALANRHGVIVIDYNFLSNRNRLNWPKMKCNRLHCQFNRNRRLRSRLNLEIFTLLHCALNLGCGGWVSFFIMVCYGYVSVEAISRLCASNPDSPWASTAFVANSHFVAATPFVDRQK